MGWLTLENPYFFLICLNLFLQNRKYFGRCTDIEIEQIIVLKGPSLASSSFIFSHFKQTIRILQQINVKNVHPVSGTVI